MKVIHSKKFLPDAPVKNRYSYCKKLLSNFNVINQQSVQAMPETIKQDLLGNTPIRMRELVQLNCFASSKVKNFLDSNYGQNNYTVIAIGRSVSSIAELLKYLGVDVKIIPMSGLRKTDLESIPAKDVEVYRSYLKSIGLSKDELAKNKDRKYILMDYAYYGRTLNRTEKFLKRDDMLGESENLIKMPIDEPLGDDYTNKRFNTLFQYNRFKDYSYVGKLPAENLSDVNKQSSPDKAPEFQGNITKNVRKLFWFNVFDSFLKNDFINCNPKNEFNALYKHYLSPSAIQHYLAREMNKATETAKEISVQNRKS